MPSCLFHTLYLLLLFILSLPSTPRGCVCCSAHSYLFYSKAHWKLRYVRMGKKLDALLGRTFKVSKFKPTVNLAISRLAVLKNQRQVRFRQARSDVLQLLQAGQHERALLRVRYMCCVLSLKGLFFPSHLISNS